MKLADYNNCNKSLYRKQIISTTKKIMTYFQCWVYLKSKQNVNRKTWINKLTLYASGAGRGDAFLNRQNLFDYGRQLYLYNNYRFCIRCTRLERRHMKTQGRGANRKKIKKYVSLFQIYLTIRSATLLTNHNTGLYNNIRLKANNKIQCKSQTHLTTKQRM